MLTNFKTLGKHVISRLSRLKNNAWRGAWILGLSHAIANAALPVAVGNAAMPSLAPLLKGVTPAVVNISVLTKSAIEDNPLFRDPFFRRFFDVPEKREPQVSAGSGVIVDAAKGYVLTNNHVIRNAQQILVTLKDRRQLEAKLIGTDPGTDIALLKIDAKDLTAVPIGDSDNLNVGDFVVAIGNPFGLGQTVTSGIVSALGRTGLNIEGFEDFIQTDASINPGNSGGALIDLNGNLVGINTAIIGPSGGNVGIGFAVPTNMAKQVMEQLVKNGEVRRGRIGMETQDVTPDLAKALNIAINLPCAVVTNIDADSPAEKAGLKARDIIVAVNGKAIRSSADVRNRIGLVPVGEQVEFKFLRDGATKTAKVKVERPYEVLGASGESVPQLAGAAVSNIVRGMPMFGRVEGVIVVGIEPRSAAWQHGLRPGDIILGVNRKKTRTIKELTGMLRSIEGQVGLYILRGDSTFVIVVR
jgi:Do/DeqQ family serine protease